MLMIRLQRVGRRNHAEFRVVVTEHARAAKSSSYVEVVGTYNPHNDTAVFKKDRIEFWIEKGAKLSDTVHNLLVSQKIIKGDKKNVLPKKARTVAEPVADKKTEDADETQNAETTVEDKEVKEAPEEAKA